MPVTRPRALQKATRTAAAAAAAAAEPKGGASPVAGHPEDKTEAPVQPEPKPEPKPADGLPKRDGREGEAVVVAAAALLEAEAQARRLDSGCVTRDMVAACVLG